MVSKVILVVGLVVAVVSAIPAQPSAGGWAGAAAWPGAGVWGGNGGANPWIPPWVAAAPWYPQWTPCAAIGTTCLDCNTKLVCTKVGGLQRACSDPTLPYCNLGECSATPTDECTPSDVSATAA